MCNIVFILSVFLTLITIPVLTSNTSTSVLRSSTSNSAKGHRKELVHNSDEYSKTDRNLKLTSDREGKTETFNLQDEIVATDNGEETEVNRWLAGYNEEALNLFKTVALVEWQYYTNMTKYNRNLLIQTRLKKAAFERASARKALTWDWQTLNDVNNKRQLEKIVDIGISATDERTKFERAVWLETEEDKRYSNAKMMVDGKVKDVIADMLTRISPVENVNYIEDIWRELYDSHADIKDLFTERIGLTNEAFQLLGYRDVVDYWTSLYEIHNLQHTLHDMWNQVQTLYELLFKYVHHKLKEIYKDDSLFPNSGHIPEYLVGSMGSADWLKIYDAVKPYPDVAELNITKELHQKVDDVEELARIVYEFFKSVELNVSSTSFWKESIFTKLKHADVSCIPKALNMYDKNVRLQMCGTVDEKTFLLLFELLGEAIYISSYREHPVTFQSEAVPNLGSAIGGTIALSSLIPANLKCFDIVESVSEGYKSDVNFLLWMALRILPRLAQDYATGLWKMDVYSRYINSTHYNSHWWNLRCKYEGVSAAVMRSESDFDAGCVLDAWKLMPYYRSFMNIVLQFQIYDALCYKSGLTGALHKCNILENKYVGQQLRSIMSLGSSIPWQRQVKVLTGDEGLNILPLMSYFSPLKYWLQGELANIQDLTELGKTCDWVVSKAVSAPKLMSSYAILYQILLLSQTVIVVTFLSST